MRRPGQGSIVETFQLGHGAVDCALLECGLNVDFVRRVSGRVNEAKGIELLFELVAQLVMALRPRLSELLGGYLEVFTFGGEIKDLLGCSLAVSGHLHYQLEVEFFPLLAVA